MVLDWLRYDWLMDFNFELTAKRAKVFAKDTKFQIKKTLVLNVER